MKRRSPKRPADPLDLRRFLRRRRTRRWSVVLIAVVAVALVAWVDRRGWLLVPPDDMTRFDGRPATVVRVIDGDTLEVLPVGEVGEPTRVRLWGIDTPELAKPSRRLPAEPGAEAARDAAEQLVTSQPVVLHLEPHRTRGNFGRLLAHVELADGRDFAAIQVQTGLARAERRWSHSRYDRLESLERDARRDKVGIWAK